MKQFIHDHYPLIIAFMAGVILGMLISNPGWQRLNNSAIFHSLTGQIKEE
jgi:hypothetical protein